MVVQTRSRRPAPKPKTSRTVYEMARAAARAQSRQKHVRSQLVQLVPYGDSPYREVAVPFVRKGTSSQMSNQKQLLKKWDNSSQFPRMVGRGDYKTFFRNVGRGIQTVGRAIVPEGTFGRLGAAVGGGAGTVAGGTLAGPVGGYAGGVVGGTLGKRAGDSFAKLVGFGDYQVSANSLMDLPMGTQVASFGNMSNSTVIRHREFVMNIVTPTDPAEFTNIRVALNPGLRAVFPWLSTIAGNYQEYQFIGCVLEYRSLSSDSASALPLGSVTIASNYDTADPNYGDKREMLNSQFCVSDKPSRNMVHPIECDPKVTFVPIKYTRNGAIATGTDSRLYDHCNVQIATEGLPSAAGEVLGELWITYEIALYKPQLGGSLNLRDHFFNDATVVGNILTASPFGANAASTAVVRGGTTNGLGVTLTSNAIVLPQGTAPGRYEVSINWRHTVAGSMTGNVVLTPSTGEVVISSYYDGAPALPNGTKIVQTASAIDQYLSYRLFGTFAFSITQPLTSSCSLVCSAFTAAATCASVEIQVAALPSLQQ